MSDVVLQGTSHRRASYVLFEIRSAPESRPARAANVKAIALSTFTDDNHVSRRYFCQSNCIQFDGLSFFFLNPTK